MNSQPQNNEPQEVDATVKEALPNTLFRVTFGDGTESIAYLAGKMRFHRIKVLVGDKVLVLTEPYGGKCRIVRRF